ncbi:MAG: hypothetical protein Q4C53_08085 [Clostridia bacterium]|nr:hypothetical protein [Clostridia bacterium]
MKYALNIGEGGRILSVTFARFAMPWMPLSDTLPEGDITDYRFIGAEYVYDPLPRPEPPEEPTIEERLDECEMTADMAYINSELALAMLEEF